jgi:hypothetical protein
MAFLVPKKLRIHYIMSEIFSFKIGQYGYQKIRIFTHRKKVIGEKQIFQGLLPFFQAKNLFSANNFF